MTVSSICECRCRTDHADTNNATWRFDELDISNDGAGNKDVVEDAVDSKVFGHHVAKDKNMGLVAM